jgi:hypothetical protein
VEGPKPLLAVCLVDGVNLRIRERWKREPRAGREAGPSGWQLWERPGREQRYLPKGRWKVGAAAFVGSLELLETGCRSCFCTLSGATVAAPMGFPGCFRKQQHRRSESGHTSVFCLLSPGDTEQRTPLVHCFLCSVASRYNASDTRSSRPVTRPPLPTAHCLFAYILHTPRVISISISHPVLNKAALLALTRILTLLFPFDFLLVALARPRPAHEQCGRDCLCATEEKIIMSTFQGPRWSTARTTTPSWTAPQI